VTVAGTCFTNTVPRYNLYPCSPGPPTSVEAPHARLIWLQLAAWATSPVGTEGRILPVVAVGVLGACGVNVCVGTVVGVFVGMFVAVAVGKLVAVAVGTLVEVFVGAAVEVLVATTGGVLVACGGDVLVGAGHADVTALAGRLCADSLPRVSMAETVYA
jgi:hypothetical protein